MPSNQDMNRSSVGSRTGRKIDNPKASSAKRTALESMREKENTQSQNSQREYMAETETRRRIPGKSPFDYSYPAPPKGVQYGDGSLYSPKTTFNPKGVDTPQPQLSPVKRAQKAAERQRMNTPGMGDVKSAERKESTSGPSKKPMPKAAPKAASKPTAKPSANSKSAPAKKK